METGFIIFNATAKEVSMDNCRKVRQYHVKQVMKASLFQMSKASICSLAIYDRNTPAKYSVLMGTRAVVNIPLIGYPAPTKLKLEKQSDANMTDFTVVYSNTTGPIGNVSDVFNKAEEKHLGWYKLVVGNGVGEDLSYNFDIYRVFLVTQNDTIQIPSGLCIVLTTLYLIY